jgi:hypothetical protein
VETVRGVVALATTLSEVCDQVKEGLTRCVPPVGLSRRRTAAFVCVV